MAGGIAVAPEYSREKVLVGQAAVRLFPLDSTVLTPPALPADTVPINGAWPTGWVPIGATEEGVTLAFSRSTENIMIEESSVAVDVQTTEVAFSVNATLSQDTLETMRIAFGGGTITTTPATTTTKGRKQLIVSNELQQFALGMEGKNEFGEPRRILIPVVNSVADAEAAFRRGANARRWAVSFKSLVDITECDIVDLLPMLPTP